MVLNVSSSLISLSYKTETESIRTWSKRSIREAWHNNRDPKSSKLSTAALDLSKHEMEVGRHAHTSAHRDDGFKPQGSCPN
jgi:hypothetical protein